MKFFASLFIFLTVSSYVHSQKLSSKKSSAIQSLNEKAKETIGNIRFFKDKAKVTIDDASFTASEMGVKIEVVLDQDGFPKSTYTSEFNPANITYIYDVEMPAASPIGQIKISFDNEIGYRTSYDKKKGLIQSYEKDVYFNYLKVDKDNFKQIHSELFKLKEIYSQESNEPLRSLAREMINKEFWVSGEEASNTYRLSRVYVTGCTMRFLYSLQSIGKSGDSKSSYLTIVPLDEIEDLRFDKSKSKPNCLILEAGKKGFETFIYKDSKYVPTKAVKEIPSFIDVTAEWQRSTILEELKKQVKSCGGGKLKL